VYLESGSAGHESILARGIDPGLRRKMQRPVTDITNEANVSMGVHAHAILAPVPVVATTGEAPSLFDGERYYTLNIALVHMRYSWTGGTERYLRQIAEYLVAEGHDVSIVCRSVRGDRIPGVRFVERRGFALGGAWRQWAFAKSVERHVREASYDVVYGLGKTWTHDVIRLGGGLHQTYLEHAHDATRSRFDRLTRKGALKHRLALRIEARALAPGAFRRIVTNSNMVKRDVLQRHGVQDEAVTVVYNGVNPERFDRARHERAAADLRRELGFSRDDVIVLFLGTGYGRKGLGPTIEAFAMIAKDYLNTRLMVVGFDSQIERYKDTAASLGVADRIRFLGGRSDAEVCYAASDLYVLPTLYDPFANSTLEAMASGLPAITTTANGASELIAPDVHGTVLEDGADVRRLSEALKTWMDDRKRGAAQERVRALALEYTMERTARESALVLERVHAEKAAERDGSR